MKYGLTLKPQGAIPKDSSVGVRMRRAPVQSKPETVVGVDIVGPVFLDEFNGFDELTDHPPDIGGPYSIDGPGSLADYVCDGTGGCPSAITTEAAEVISELTAQPTTYTLEMLANITALGASILRIDLSAIYLANDAYMAELFLNWNGTTFLATCRVRNRDDEALFIEVVDITSTVGTGSHALEIEVAASGVNFKINGVSIQSTAEVPDGPPDYIGWSNHTPDAGLASYATVTRVRMDAFG